MIFLLLAAETPPAPGTPVWVTLLVAIMAMVGGGLGWNIYKRWRTGQADDALEISKAAIEQARGAKDLFVEYRVELESAQKQIAEYLDQLIQVNRLLGEANGRIQRLELELVQAKTEHGELQRALQAAREDRDRSQLIREKILLDMEGLRDRIRELEGRNSSQQHENIRREVE